MVKKMNMSEKRKLERRLPLWEAAFHGARSNERKELLEKIENARKALGMEKFLKKQFEKTEIKPKKDITKKIDKKENDELNIKEMSLSPENIVYLHNVKKMKDKEIYDFFGITQSKFFQIKKKYIGTTYEPKRITRYSRNENLNFDPYEFLEMKILGMSNYSISKQFNTNHQAVEWFEDKYLNKIYVYNNKPFKKPDHKENVELIIKNLNDGIKLTKCEINGISYKSKTLLKQNYIECQYALNNIKFIPIIEYCEYANKGFKDYEIAEILNTDPNSIKNIKKNHIKSVYFLK